MRLAYVDESYDRCSYWFGAVLVPEDHDAEFQREILAIARRFAAHGVPADAELHGYPVWNGRDGWGVLEPRLREDVLRRTLRAIRRADALVVFVGIDRLAHPELANLARARAQATAELLDCLEDRCSAAVGERCLLVFDEETSTSRQLFDEVHRRHRATLLAGRDPRIFERPVIAESEHTPGIQAADVAVFLRRRQYAVPVEPDGRAQALRDRLVREFVSAVDCEIAP